MGKEEKNSSYDIDMCQFFPERKIKYDNIPEFKGPIQIVKNIPGKGRGVTATEDIKRGQLIMVSRAVEIDFEDKSSEEWKIEITDKLSNDPTRCQEIYQLHAGRLLGHISPPPSPQKHFLLVNTIKDEIPVFADYQRISKIWDINSFKSRLGSKGLWILPSYFNHDCIDFNCTWEILGDLLFVRATRAVHKGAELLVAYIDPTELFERRLEFFKWHDFVCKCRLCFHQSNEDRRSRLRKMEVLEYNMAIYNETQHHRHEVQKNIKCVESCVKEFEEMGVASGRPEWNFSICFLLETLRRLYRKVGNSEKEKIVAEKYHKVLNGCPDEEGQMTICVERGAASYVVDICLYENDWEGASKWISILKKDVSVWYGKSDMWKDIFPGLYEKALKSNVKL